MEKKGVFFSLWGVVIVIFIVIGKVFNVEVMFKECKECMVWRSKEGIVEF